MRLRNIPRADDTLQAHFTVIKNPKEFRGNWTSVFGNDRPIRIEIGMGKGRFLLNMAKTFLISTLSESNDIPASCFGQ
mgnify:FL=1